MVVFLFHNKYIFIALTLLVIINFLHAILLDHFKVVFTIVQPDYRDVINPLLPLILHFNWKHLKI